MQNVYRRTIKYIIIIVLIAAVGITSYLLIRQQTETRPATAKEDSSQTEKQQTDYVVYTGKKDSTALAQLKQQAGGVVTKPSSFGEYVDAIGNYKGGQDGKYWSFYVDGKLSAVGADTYVAKGGEKIEWKFEKLQ